MPGALCGKRREEEGMDEGRASPYLEPGAAEPRRAVEAGVQTAEGMPPRAPAPPVSAPPASAGPVQGAPAAAWGIGEDAPEEDPGRMVTGGRGMEGGWGVGREGEHEAGAGEVAKSFGQAGVVQKAMGALRGEEGEGGEGGGGGGGGARTRGGRDVREAIEATAGEQGMEAEGTAREPAAGAGGGLVEEVGGPEGLPAPGAYVSGGQQLGYGRVDRAMEEEGVHEGGLPPPGPVQEAPMEGLEPTQLGGGSGRSLTSGVVAEGMQERIPPERIPPVEPPDTEAGSLRPAGGSDSAMEADGEGGGTHRRVRFEYEGVET